MSMDALIGKTLGQYRIVEEIGRGGMAVVYRAYQLSLNRYVAIKVLPPQFTFDTTFVQRFVQEARAAARLEHPNIVTIHDVGEQDGTYYIVMQELQGEPLSRLIQRDGRLPLARVIHIVSQIASALDYAHAHGFVHRDIKPGNIIVGPSDHATLTDFGIAKAAEGTQLTQSGVMVGTPEYMSPEQAKGEEVGPATDVYSLGITTYEMLAGRVPFKADSTPAVLHKQVYEQPGPVRVHASYLPAGVDGVLSKALAKDPARRFQSAGELAKVLQETTVGKPSRQGKLEPPTIIAPVAARKRMPWLMPVFGGVLVLMLVVFGLLARGGKLTPSATPVAVISEIASPSLTVVATAGVSLPTSVPSSTTSVPPTPAPVVIVVTATSLPATDTPVPPTSTPVPLPTPTRACRWAVDSQLASAWDRGWLGCPTASANIVWAAWQPFERGYMFWRSDTWRASVLYDDGTWKEFPDQWDGVTVVSRGNPPAGRVAPVRGFGYLWGTHDEVASRLGWGLEEERGFCANIQSFERSFIFHSTSAVQHCWEDLYNYATDPAFTPLFFAMRDDNGTWRRY